MQDYSEKTATMQTRIVRLSDALAMKRWAYASGIAVDLMCDLAYVIAFCKSNKK